MKVLIVEDDSVIVSFVKKGLKEAGYCVDCAADGLTGFQRALHGSYDVLIVDIMLPELDGLQVIERLRSRQIMTPVLVLSAKNTVDDRIKGLELGCDDYMVKPFSFAELLARIHALLRRSQHSNSVPALSAAGLTMDIAKRKVHRDGSEITLRPREYALLEYLLRNTGRVVSKTMIMEHVWDFHFDPQTNIVETVICRLRDKVDRPFARKLIHTMRGAGYVIEG